MLTSLLTKERFKLYLETTQDRAVARSACNCVMANFLRHIGAKQPAVFGKAYVDDGVNWDGIGNRQLLPAWAQRVVHTFDAMCSAHTGPKFFQPAAYRAALLPLVQ